MSKNRYLASKRTWVFQADVRGYYIPEKPLVIDDFELKTIEDEEKGTRYIALLTVQANYYDAEKLAREKFERIFNALTLSTGRGFDFELVDAKEITPKGQKEKFYERYISMKFPFVEVLKSEKIEQVCDQTQEILGWLHKTDPLSEKAIEYFIIGTKLHLWPREAFLPFFKAIELISNNYSREWKARIKEKMPDLEPKEINMLANNRRKILNACEILGIEKVNEKIDTIVRARNRYDIAHATLKRKFKKEHTDACRELARELIVNYLKIPKKKEARAMISHEQKKELKRTLRR